MERKAQGAIEYILILSGIVFVVVIAITMLQSNIFKPSINQTETTSATYSDFIKCLSGNVVPNPGFEQDANLDGIPDSWTNTSGAVADYSGAQAQTGRAAINVSGSGTFTSIRFNITPNTNYVLVAYAKSPDASPNLGITANTFLDGLSAGANLLRTGITSQYAAYKTEFSAPANNAYLEISSGSGTITVDNVCVSKE